jgi:hypothetical protein
MRLSVLIMGATALLLSAPLQAAEPDVLKAVREAAQKSYETTTAASAEPEPTEQEKQAEKQAIERSREAFFNRLEERGVQVPGA